MEHRENEAKEHSGGVRGQDEGPHGYDYSDDRWSGEACRFPDVVAGEDIEAQGPTEWQGPSSWINWQSALYVLVLGVVCVPLSSLTSFWWIVPVLGALVPLGLVMLQRPDLKLGRPDAKKDKEKELLNALVERGEVMPTTAAMYTSLTVDEASKMLDGLAGKGHLKFQTEDGVMAYAIPERDRRPEQSGSSTLSESGAEEVGALEQLNEPLSERELEILTLLASGRTNAEIAKDLFIAVGTVKSHINNIYRKLDACNRAEAVTRARENNLLR